jgi:YggT family protein
VLTVLIIIQVILIAYLFILALRIVLGWFAPQALGRAWDLLARATDPYLAVFSRMKFLRAGVFDFSPIAAVLVIVVALDLVYQLLYYGGLRLGFFLASLFSAAWSGARFLLLLFLIVGLIRLVAIFMRAAPGSGIWRVLDMIVQPIVAWFMRLFRVKNRVNYVQSLVFTVGLLLVVWLFMELVVVRRITDLFLLIPF